MTPSLATLYRDEHARVLGALLGKTRDFPLAEEAVQDAFEAAATQWSEPPPNPRAWLIRVATNKLIDRLRRQAKFVETDDGIEQLEASAQKVDDDDGDDDGDNDDAIPDERLRLIFTCCHPALAPDAQVALTLRTVAGLTTEEIARLFVAEPAAIAQRLVRTQKKIRDARIPYAVPPAELLGERVAGAFAVVYLVFTEGYAAVRAELCDEAIRLGRTVVELLPHEPEAAALLALILLHDSRRAARVADGELVMLEDQDRARWNRAQIGEGLALLDRALAAGAAGPYALQAAIAALHARAPSADAMDWRQIVELYDLLLAAQPTPIVELNRAIAIAMARGAEAGLKALDALRWKLAEDHLFHAARADVLVRVGRRDDAARAYRAALERVGDPAERRLLERRLAALR